ncbi:MAG: hypothetical protein LBB14_03285 [Puniceicoccales bacterium]|jgi:hypothetical protein|nr:hypothetical protein [Puniceicoccales bacterium]
MSRAGGLIFLLSLLCAGCCARYHLGTCSQPPFSTISVAPVESLVDCPGLRGILWHQTCQEIQQIATAGAAAGATAGELTLRIVSLDRIPTLSAPNCGGDQRITLVALCTLRDRRTGATPIADRPVRASVYLPGGQDIYGGQAMSELTAALAREIRDLVANSW